MRKLIEGAADVEMYQRRRVKGEGDLVTVTTIRYPTGPGGLRTDD